MSVRVEVLPSISGPIAGGTEGSVLFVGPSSSIAQDNANFFWDDTNNRLGLGVNSSLTAKLNITVGSATEIGAFFKAAVSQSANLLTFQDSSSNSVLQFRVAVTAQTPLLEIGNTTLDANQHGFKLQGASGYSVVLTSSSRYLSTADYFQFLSEDSAKNVGLRCGSRASGNFGLSVVAANAQTASDSLFVVEDFDLVDQIYFTVAGGAVFNEQGKDADFRIEGDTDANLLFLDASTDRVGIGTSGPDQKLDILHASSPQLRLTQADASVYTDFQTNSSGTLVLTPTGGNVAINLDLGVPARLQLFKSVSSDTGADIYGLYNNCATSVSQTGTLYSLASRTGCSHTSGNVPILYGLQCQASKSGAGGTAGYVVGISGLADVSGSSGTTTNLIGINAAVQSTGAGGVTDSYSLLLELSTLNAGTWTNWYGVRSRINSISGSGAITNAYGVYIDDILLSGVTTGYSFVTNSGLAVFNEGGNSLSDVRIEGDTDVNLFFTDASADTVQVGASTASDSAKFYVSGKVSCSGEAEINGALNHDGSTVGFYGVTPTARSSAYTPTNVTTDRSYDADATTVGELADVLGTLIADLQATGIIG